ncbi:MAG: response regulator, partial [Deltaproteobacteria bacterium]|nr:response regulator [Deltaproteobacteria bacterium]
CNKKKNGEIFWERAAIAPVFDDSDEITHYIASKEDITERREAEKELASLALFTHLNPSPVFRIDKEGYILQANSASQKLFTTENPQGKILSDVCPDLDRDMMKRVLSANGVLQVERKISGKDLLFSFTYEPEYEVINVYGADISLLKETERNLKKHINELADMRLAMLNMMSDLEAAKEKAEDAVKAKSIFLANMSHEIRTPMNAIIGLTTMALQTKLTRKQQDYCSKIDSSAHSLLQIINDILDFSKIEADRLEMENVDFNLNEVLKRVSNQIVLKAEEKGVELILNIAPDVPFGLQGDPLRLEQVLINLVNNAVKFTDKGEILVSTELVSKKSASVKLRFSIRDTGIGMNMEQASSLFLPFSQADTSTTRRYGGSGLGLSICRKLVEMMGGEINVESELGVGSTFSFTATFGRAADETMQMTYQVPPKHHGMRVLVVDDSKTMQHVLANMLESLSFKVSVAGSGEEALEMTIRAAAAGNPFKLVFMDWKMSGLNGIKTARIIKNDTNLSEKPVIIIVTAYGRTGIFKKAKEAGLDGLLTKPVTPSTLFDAILDVFGLTEEKKIDIPQYEFLPPGIERVKDAKVLLAEDNKINQQVAVELLKKAGIIVEVVNNGIKALAAVQRRNYDLVLMDIQMPEMDGLEATGKIRKMEKEKHLNEQTYRQLPIIAMTAHAMIGDREKSLGAGMNGHITKPVNPAELYAALMQWIRPGERKPGQGDNREEEERPAGSETSGSKRIFEGTVEEATKVAALPDQLPGINVRQGLMRTAGNEKLYRNILSQFLGNQENVGEKIREAFEQEDFEEAGRLVHTLKGVSGTIGANELHKAASELDSGIKQKQDRDSLYALLEIAQNKLLLVLSSIAGVKESPEEGPAAGIREKILDKSAKKKLYTRLDELLADNDTEAISLFEEFKAAMLTTEGVQEKLAAMENALSNYDFDSARQSLSEIAPLIV